MLPYISEVFLHVLTHSTKDMILDVLTPSDVELNCIPCGGISGANPLYNPCGDSSSASS